MTGPDRRPVRLRLKRLRADLLGTQKRLVTSRGGFARYRVLHRVFTLLAGADANNRVFFDNLSGYGRGLQHKNLELIIGRGLICTDGEEWRQQRALTQPAFNRALLERVVAITSTLTSELLAGWDRARERGEPVEVFGDMQTLAMRVMSMSLFSHDPQTIDNDFVATVRVGLEVVVRRNLSPVTLPLWFPTTLHRRFRGHLRAVDRFVADRIDERFADNSLTDILGDLIRSYGVHAPDHRRELRDQVVTLFFAGFETTGSALAWTWLLLSRNEESEARFHEELASVLGGRDPDYDDLSRLTHTRQVVQESLRLHPPVYTLTRRAEVDDGPVHRGDNVLIPVHALQRMPEYWEDPEVFCPERFAPGRMTEAQRKVYTPFAAGRRKCIGTNFATTEMLTVLAVVGQRVRLRLVDGHSVRPAVAVTQYPAQGLPMYVLPVGER
ncbi:MAG: cytochrome P450 [Actinomycetota bacterium]|nr:cytochrome P450 [Actinomycetota bacterium]